MNKLVLMILVSGWLSGHALGATATVETSGGTFVIELFADKAPKTVAHFVELASTGFYEKKHFHKVVPGRLIQGGAAKKDGTGGPGYCVDDEFHKELRHSEAGMVSLVSDGGNEGGSQFVVLLGKVSRYDNRYSVFGKVVEGMETVTKIAKAKLIGSRPATPVTIRKVTIAGKAPATKFRKRFELDKKAAEKVVEPVAKKLASSIGKVQNLGDLQNLTIKSVNSRCDEAQVYTNVEFSKYKNGSLLLYGSHQGSQFDIRQFQFARGRLR